MKFNGVELILDNFRDVLKDYSLDVQDVVRSAILDGKDISAYIESCKENPDRLNQIRLGMKENIPAVFFKVRSGHSIYQIRLMLRQGRKLSWLEKQIDTGVLSDDNLDVLVSWVDKDYDLKGIDISIIPTSMLDSFEYGLSKGFDMTPFNNGKVYSSEYVRLCLALSENKKDYTQFIKGELYDISVMKVLVNFSKSADKGKWGKLMSVISQETPEGKVKKLIQCINNSIPVTGLGKPEWDESTLDLILYALSEGLDYKALIGAGPDAHAVSVKCNELFWQKSKEKRVGGILRKG